MNRRSRILIVLGTPFVLGLIIGFFIGFCSKGSDGGREDAAMAVVEKEFETQVDTPTLDTVEGSLEGMEEGEPDDLGPQAEEIIYSAPRMSYAKTFHDLNEHHLEVAKQVGLSSIPQNRDSLERNAELVPIMDCDYYIVDKLNFSAAYLTSAAAEELERIGRNFKDSLESKQLVDYKLIISSLLRTEADVRRLRRSGNPNASDRSAHCYGTTFDITYTRYFCEDETERFMQPYELTKVLAEVLRDERAQGRCLVKYERKEHCFHITSTATR